MVEEQGFSVFDPWFVFGGSCSTVDGMGFIVSGSGFTVELLVFGVQGSLLRNHVFLGFRFWGLGLRFRVQDVRV